MDAVLLLSIAIFILLILIVIDSVKIWNLKKQIKQLFKLKKIDEDYNRDRFNNLNDILNILEDKIKTVSSDLKDMDARIIEFDARLKRITQQADGRGQEVRRLREDISFGGLQKEGLAKLVDHNLLESRFEALCKHLNLEVDHTGFFQFVIRKTK
jgi:septal ring factor EnvC (AmiA/AmiB activator)